MADLNELVERGQSDFHQPLSVTAEGIILHGFDLWRFAMQRNIEQVPCFVYALTQDDALRWLLQNNQSRHSFWNKYCRIVLALELEEGLVQQALANQRAGGRAKGLLNLSKAERVHVRFELAKLARVSPTYIDRVKILRKAADPKILDALQRGQIPINRAWAWRNLSFPLQGAALSQFLDDRETKELTRPFFRKPRPKTQHLDPSRALQALTEVALNHPEAIRAYFRRTSGAVVIIVDDVLGKSLLQGELSLA